MASIAITGNLTTDPELRYTSNNIAVCNVNIAYTPKQYDKQKQEWLDDEPLFIRGTLWKDAAENAAASFTKGTRVVATGKLKTRSYTSKEGERRQSLEIEIEEIGASIRFAKLQITRNQFTQQQPAANNPATIPAGSVFNGAPF